MKKGLFGILILLMMLLAACTPRIYGVPQERWETMSEQERITAMEAYKARQEVLRQQREEQARLRAMEKEAQLAREAEEAHRRQLQVDAIYRGEGLYGDLLRVTLEGGMLQFYGAHKPFQAVSFRIASGETKEVEMVSTRGRKARMMVYYDGSNLLLDEKPRSHRSTALRLPYEDSWETGATYPNSYAKGPLEMRGVNVTVRILGEPPREHHHRRHRPQVVIVQPPARQPKPAVIVVEKPVHRPQPNVIVVEKPAHRPQPDVIVVEKPAHRPQPNVVGIEERPASKRPDMVVVKPQPEAAKPRKIVAHRRNNNNEATELTAIPPARIKVVFRKGLLVVKKRGQPLVPQTISLHDGQTRNVIMHSKGGKLKIQVSYRKGELLIDDTPGRNRNHTRLGFVPGWNDGQRYSIETSGNRLLEDLDILIMSQ